MRILPVNTTKYGYKYGDKTFYSDFHLGLDLICQVGTPVMAPEDGEVVGTPTGHDLGLTILYKGQSGVLHRMGHNSQLRCKIGEKKKCGDLLALSGNSGALTKSPHCHYDISKNGKLELNNKANFIDPLVWVKKGQNMVTQDNTRAIVVRIYKKWLKIMEPDPADIEAQSAFMANYLNTGNEVDADKQFTDFEAGAPQGTLPDEISINGVQYKRI